MNRRTGIVLFLLGIFVISSIISCTYRIVERAKMDMPESPAAVWKTTEAPKKVLKKITVAEIPADLLASKQNWTLVNLIDLALRNNPDTKASWYAARSAAADYGSKRGTYYPDATFDFNVLRLKGSAVGGQFNYTQTSYTPTLSIYWLVFDFGGREAEIQETRQALIAANYAHNAVIQQVILQVEQAYYSYLYAKALVEAEEINLKGTQANFDAAQQRFKAGVATIADVLQAKTAVSQAQLALDSARGQIQIIRGVLASAVGLPATTPYDIEDILPENISLDQTSASIEVLIDEAFARRPDLAELRARAVKSEAHIKNVKSKGLPLITASGSISRVFYENNPVRSNNYSGSLLFRVPVFTGFSQGYDEVKARADAEVLDAQLSKMEQEVVLQVWTSYYNLKTAEQRIRSSQDLLESAEKNHQVALERYKAGVGTFLDLLAAQSALENARAQHVLARTDWFLSLVQLAYDTGTLEISTDSKESGTALQTPQGGNQ